MTSVPELLADCNRLGIRLIPNGQAELTIDAPHDILTPHLVSRLKALKPKLLEHFKFQHQAQRIMDGMRDQLSAAYTGRDIVWDTLDRIDQRIDDAFKNRNLTALRDAVSDYLIEFHRLGLDSTPEEKSVWNERDEVNFQDIIKAFQKGA